MRIGWVELVIILVVLVIFLMIGFRAWRGR